MIFRFVLLLLRYDMLPQQKQGIVLGMLLQQFYPKSQNILVVFFQSRHAVVVPGMLF